MAVVELPQPRQELRRAILLSGMASWQVGHLAGVSPTVLSHIVTGRRNPRPTEAARLAQVLGASVGVLFPDLDERP